jgi:inner membrane protein COX18
MPELEKLKPLVAKRVFEDMKKAGMGGDKKALQQYHTEKTVEVVSFHPLFHRFVAS